MIRILCAECKNAYLQLKDAEYICSACGAVHPAEDENLLLGIHFYNECNYEEAGNCLMKYIVKNGAEPRAIFYKALCDGYNFDEDTVSLGETYSKLTETLAEIDGKDFPKYLALANDEAEKLELALAEVHVRLFADADSEKIKKEVSVILQLQKEAQDFRTALSELTATFNENNEITLLTKFSDCFLVDIPIATEVGNVKYQKICDNIASHTVFTGILSTDIKNLEIYYRCIVMFFQKSHDKYEFLLEESAKFTKLAEILAEGQYNTIKGVGSIADKLKNISYDFLQESYKEHFDEQIDMQIETVVIVEPELAELEEEPAELEEISSASPVAEALQTEETSTPEDATQVIDLPAEENKQAEKASEETVEEETVEEDATADAVEEAVDEELEEEPAESDSAEAVDAEIPVAVAEETAETAETEEPAETAEPETEETAATVTIPVSDVTSSDISLTDIANAPIKTLAEVLSEESVEDSAEESAEESVTEDSADASEKSVTEVIELPSQDEAQPEETPVENTAATEEKPQKAKKKKSHKGVAVFVFVIIAVLALAGVKYGPGVINDYNYKKACEYATAGDYDNAIDAFTQLGAYADSEQKAKECLYNKATALEGAGSFTEARLIFEKLDTYMDSSTRATACTYGEAKKALEENNFDLAIKLFTSIKDYGDSATMIKECSYKKATTLIESKDYESAIELLSTIKKYSDSGEKINEAKYLYVTENFKEDNKTTVKYLNELTKANYRNSAELRKELLGSAEVTSDKIKAFVNYSRTDLETSLTELDNTKVIYFHVIANDKALYGKTLTLKYTTAFGYSQRESVTFTSESNSTTMLYPSTAYKNYTVTFELLDTDGTALAKQTITF